MTTANKASKKNNLLVYMLVKIYKLLAKRVVTGVYTMMI